jgi:hypothetical protein
LAEGKADAMLVARAFLRNLGLVWKWAGELGVEVRIAKQIGWGFGQKGEGDLTGGHAATAGQ